MKGIGLSLLAIGLCLAPTLPRQADEKTKTSSPAKSGTQSSPLQTSNSGVPQPAQEILTLTAALEGTWALTEKYEPIYLTPKGGEGTGEQVFRAGPGGFTLSEDYHSNTPAGELFGFGVLWWDQTKGIQHMWCINIFPTGCEMFPAPPQPGPRWDGKQLVIHIEGAKDGKKVVWHEVISDITPHSFVQTADIGESGGQLKRWFTIHAVRSRGAVIPRVRRVPNQQ
jgi:hypothetical protein